MSGAQTTLRMLAARFELIGGVPQVVLSDRMGCLRQTTIAGLVVPHPAGVMVSPSCGGSSISSATKAQIDGWRKLAPRSIGEQRATGRR